MAGAIFFAISAFLDINMYLFRDMTPESYAGALAFLAAGCLIQAFGVVLSDGRSHIFCKITNFFRKILDERKMSLPLQCVSNV